MVSNSLQQILTKAFQSQLIPWSKSGALKPFLVQLPSRVPNYVQVNPMFQLSLADAEHYPLSLNPYRWPEFGLHAGRYPCMGCVLEGETDISIGLRRESDTDLKGAKAEIHVNSFSMSRQDFFMIPAGTPYSDASRPHWQRPNPEMAHARTLWMRILPMGPIFHISSTQGLSHQETRAILIRDSRLLSLTEFLMSSAQRLSKGMEATQACLLALLLTIDQGWAQSHVLVEDTSKSLLAVPKPDGKDESETSNTITVAERAHSYINENLTKHALTLPQIALHAYISVPQLKRLFKSEFKMSVMEYVTQRRIETAKSLLAETDLPIGEVSVLSGYQQRAHFSRLFAHHVGMPPREFRRQSNAAPANAAVTRKGRI